MISWVDGNEGSISTLKYGTLTVKWDVIFGDDGILLMQVQQGLNYRRSVGSGRCGLWDTTRDFWKTCVFRSVYLRARLELTLKGDSAADIPALWGTAPQQLWNSHTPPHKFILTGGRPVLGEGPQTRIYITKIFCFLSVTYHLTYLI